MKPEYEPAEILLSKINGKERTVLLKKFLSNFGLLYADLTDPEKQEDNKVQFQIEDVIQKLFVPKIKNIFTKVPVEMIKYDGVANIQLFKLIEDQIFVVNRNDTCWKFNNLGYAIAFFNKIV